ncbi:hypothetical protein ABW636_10365 [Aquimarina sp. 2201CG1-2-11]|uniref:hypothetical protein n=1 Tax=Aquimarina discodermiae TaxID=3231043 RepID=UPI0034621F8B
MNKGEPTNISLTGKNSHSITISPGQGSFTIGAIGMDTKKYDVLVDNDLPINWDSFNLLFTSHGKKHSDLHPYGNWPRVFRYSGNDSNFSKWSEKREIEQFTWTPLKPVSADFSKAKISGLIINAENHKINLKLGNHSGFSLTGNIANVDIESVVKVDSLAFHPSTDKSSKTPYKLPTIKEFSKASKVSIYVEPFGQAFDCKSLLQFKNLTSLELYGNVTNLQYLEQFENLDRLAIRYAPNLKELPSLKSWKKLTSFIGWNIEETKGKLLRSELKKLTKERELDYSTVSQLRKSIWFTTEYGIPFSAWKGKNAKSAIKNYKATLKKLKKVKTEKEAKEILIDFTKTFNDLSQIETTEREDIGEAIEQLRQIPSFEIDAKKAIKWFDEVRNY